MKLQLVLMVTDDDGKPITTAGIGIQSDKSVERITRIFAGIDDALTLEDTINAIGLDLTSNAQQAMDATAKQFCLKLLEIHNENKTAENTEKAAQNGN